MCIESNQNCPSLGKTAYVYGWGTTSSGGASSSKLLEVGVPVVTSAQCATSMGPMEGGQICAGGEAGKDSCQVLTFLKLSRLLLSSSETMLSNVCTMSTIELN